MLNYLSRLFKTKACTTCKDCNYFQTDDDGDRYYYNCQLMVSQIPVSFESRYKDFMRQAFKKKVKADKLQREKGHSTHKTE